MEYGKCGMIDICKLFAYQSILNRNNARTREGEEEEKDGKKKREKEEIIFILKLERSVLYNYDLVDIL
jgi:hypothetical protein